jgi:hypothetical protein
MLTCIVLYFVFQKRIKNTWTEIELYVSQKSSFLAKLLPHLTVFGLSLMISIVGKKFIIPFTTKNVMPLFTLGIPLCLTLLLIRNVYKSSIDEISAKDSRILTRKCNEQMIIWVVIATYHSFVTMLSLLPFSNQFATVLPFIKEMVIVVSVGIQLSPFFAQTLHHVVSPALKKISKLLPTSDFEQRLSQSGIASTLIMIRLINEKQAMYLKAAFQDGVITVITVGFILTPQKLALIGVVIVAWLFPIFRCNTTIIVGSSSSAQRLKQTPSAEEFDEQIQPIEDAKVSKKQLFWLKYWCVLTCTWLVRVYVVDFWSCVLLLFTLWLQHSYFKGVFVLETLVCNVLPKFSFSCLRYLPFRETKETSKRKKIQVLDDNGEKD